MSNTSAEKTCRQPDPDTFRECEAASSAPNSGEQKPTGNSPTPEGQDDTEQLLQPTKKTFLDHVRDSIPENADLGRLLAE